MHALATYPDALPLPVPVTGPSVVFLPVSMCSHRSVPTYKWEHAVIRFLFLHEFAEANEGPDYSFISIPPLLHWINQTAIFSPLKTTQKIRRWRRGKFTILNKELYKAREYCGTGSEGYLRLCGGCPVIWSKQVSVTILYLLSLMTISAVSHLKLLPVTSTWAWTASWSHLKMLNLLRKNIIIHHCIINNQFTLQIIPAKLFYL